LQGLFSIIVVSIVLVACKDSSDSGDLVTSCAPETGIAGDGRLDLIVDCIRVRNQLPALAAIIVHDGQIIEKSAVGKRSAAADVPVSIDDQWHIGSITKSMTSTVAALLVRDGYIRWDSTLSEVYPELVDVMRSEYLNVRLDELLSHTSGLPLDTDWEPYHTDTRTLSAQHQAFVEQVLILESTTTYGVVEYNNDGYIVAGAMLEKVTGSSWEKLMQNYLFNPLAMTQAGFGSPDTLGQLAQPVGHTEVDGAWYPVDPAFEDISDDPPMAGPDGSVHVSLDDMAAYLGLHLRGSRGETVDGFLSGQEFAKLYTPLPNSSYALGWDTADGVILHDGSNTIWYALAIVSATNNTALFMVTNAVDDEENPDSQLNKAMSQLFIELSARADAAFR